MYPTTEKWSDWSTKRSTPPPPPPPAAAHLQAQCRGVSPDFILIFVSQCPSTPHQQRLYTLMFSLVMSLRAIRTAIMLFAAHLQAQCRGVFPDLSLMFTSQCPSMMKHFTMFKCPFLQIEVGGGMHDYQSTMALSHCLYNAHVRNNKITCKPPAPHGLILWQYRN